MRFPISALLVVFALWAPCSAVAQLDLDQDGFFDTEDCNDGDPTIHPGADDVACDGVDTDCDGTVEIWYRDADGDGVGTNSDVLITCTQPPGYVAIRFDCDDNDPLRFPGATDPCDGFDADCDGNGERWYADLDGDGYGVLSSEVIACVQPPNTAILTGDCNDNEPNVSPEWERSVVMAWTTIATAPLMTRPLGMRMLMAMASAAMRTRSWHASNRLVTPRTPAIATMPTLACTPWQVRASVAPRAPLPTSSTSWTTTARSGTSPVRLMVDNTPGLTGQAAVERYAKRYSALLVAIAPSCRQCIVERAYCAYLSCRSSCNPWPSGEAGNLYPGTPTCNQCVALGGCNVAFNACVGVIDQDGDGYLSTYDCDDLTPTTNPGADELCDGVDNDCNGLIDDNFPLVYADSDGDGYGDPNALVMCATPGSVANNTDCNDTNAAIHPNAAELIDGIDNDCDGQVDEIQCNDSDEDGTTDCQGDCDDNEPTVHPSAAEICGDGLDNDCNGTIDDQTTWYEDTDGDGFGTESNTLLACEQPIGYSPEPGDCDDADAGVYPLAGPGIGCSSCSAADKQWIADNYVAVWEPCRTSRGRFPWSHPAIHRMDHVQ